MRAGTGSPTDGAGVGALLRAWRMRALLTQEQLAERAGLNVRTVRRLESDDTMRPQGATLRLLVTALDLTAAEQEALAAAARGAATPSVGPSSGGDGAPPVPASPGKAVPRQLPAPPPGFTGRTAELADLDRVHDMTAVVITAIDGMAGIGKTALAVHAAHRLAGHYPDGQLFVDLHGYTEGVPPVAPGDALERLLRVLGVPAEQIPHDLDDRAVLYRSRLADRKVLILLDNVATEAQVGPLLPGTPGCLVMVTSRHRLSGLDQTRTLALDVLPPADAMSLFTRTAGDHRLRGESPGTLAEIVELCGRLPLAIRIAAARLRSRPSWTAAHLVERLRDLRERLGELEVGSRSVAAALDLSYLQLGPDVRRVYRLCGLHPGTDFDLHAVAALGGSSEREAERLIGELLDTHLIQELVPGRYRFHDLIRAHAAAAAGREETEAGRRAARDRMIDYYSHTASMAMDIGYPYERQRHPPAPPVDTPVPELRDAPHATAWLDAELPNLLTTAWYAAEHGKRDRAVHLSTSLDRHLRVRHRYAEAEALHERALALARGMRNPVAEADALLGRGQFAMLQQKFEPAAESLRRALAIADAHDHGICAAGAHVALGQLLRIQGRDAAAAGHYERALEVLRGVAYPSAEVEALIGLGWLHMARGQLAADDFERALAVAQATGYQAGELHALRGLSNVHRQLGRYEQAIGSSERALSVSRSTGDPLGELSALVSLAWTYRLQARYSAAADAYRQALEQARRLGNLNWEFEALEGMGRLDTVSGHPVRGLARLGRALEIAADLRQPVDEARAHEGLARAHHALGDREQARRHWQAALDILTELGTDIAYHEEVTAAAIRAHLSALGS